jgi:hypothetical protein
MQTAAFDRNDAEYRQLMSSSLDAQSEATAVDDRPTLLAQRWSAAPARSTGHGRMPLRIR